MRRCYLTIIALSAALVLPTAASARDGEEARHWRDFPGAEFAVPNGLGNRYDLFVGAPRTGFALQAPLYSPAPRPLATPFGQDGRLGVSGTTMPVPQYPIEPETPPTAPSGY